MRSIGAEDPAQQSLPRHIAIIMDGNGRWAEARGLPRVAGHRRGNPLEVLVHILHESMPLRRAKLLRRSLREDLDPVAEAVAIKWSLHVCRCN